jgi:peptidoglycan biosynthesis protein MviN/MurJ (putative lipid II flippase)
MALWRSGALVATLLLIGRATGFAREWLLSARGGASAATDLSIVLLTLPDLLVNLLLGGGLTAALVPALQALPPRNRTTLAAQVALLIGILFGCLGLVVALTASPILKLLAPGLPITWRALGTSPLAVVASLAVPLTALSGVTVALLNAQGLFALGASGTLLFNMAVISALCSHLPLPWAIALGVVAGSLLRFLAQGIGFRPAPLNGYRIWRPWLLDWGLIRRFAGNLSFVTALVVLPPIARAWASASDPGALSLFNYASKLVDLPMGVVIGSLTTVLLPRLAANPCPRVMGRALQLTAVVALAISLPALLNAAPLAKLVYFRAHFTPEQGQELGLATAVAFAFLLPQALLSLYGTLFAAAGRTRPLVIAGILMVLALLLLAPLGLQLGGFIGVMASYGTVQLLGAVLLTGLTWRQFGPDPFRFAMGLPPSSKN